MEESKYTYRINSLQLKKGVPFTPGRINVFVGANNCGKTQILKDMLGYITGSKTSSVILDEMDIAYPETWEEFKESYEMNVAETVHGKQLRLISPTLDADPSGPTMSDLEDRLQQWIKSNKYLFRSNTGAGMITYLNTDNRLKLAMSQTVQKDLQNRGPKNVLEALYVAGLESTMKVRQCIKRIFNTDVYLDTSNLGMIQYRVGTDFSPIPENSQVAYKELIQYPLLDGQGDGLRSVLGMISALVSLKKPIILLDEPEAFLHPPQALQLGEIISDLVDESQQIFIATHSADFLRGLIGSSKDAVIVRIDRSPNDDANARVLDPATLNQIVTDPLLSSSRVLEGMFYKGVVATEADADAVFYQRLFQKIGASDEIHFVNAHNKQTLKKVINPYKKLGIKFAMIADADVIRDTREFKDILEVSSDKELTEQILADREKILAYFRRKSKYVLLSELQANTLSFASQQLPDENAKTEEIEKAYADFRSTLKKLREESDELADLKKLGYAALPSEEACAFDSMWQACAQIGLFIVRVGELESWLVDYGIDRTSNKSRWITNALDKIFNLEYDAEKEIWKFVDALKNFLVES